MCNATLTSNFQNNFSSLRGFWAIAAMLVFYQSTSLQAQQSAAIENKSNKQLSDYSVTELFSNSLFSPKRKAFEVFSPDGLSTLKTIVKDDAWMVTKSLIQPSADSNKNKPVTLFNTENFSKEDIIKAGFANGVLPQGSYSITKDESFMLVTYDFQQIYRHSSSSMCYVVDLKQKKITNIPVRLMYPTLSPKNDNLAYVKDNNVFIYNLYSQQTTQVTTDGETNKIINGAVDWVYEEEFSMSSGIAWSPFGNYLAFYHFDESKVKQFSMDIFQNLYPSQEKWKYPKAGEDNSSVDIHIYDIRTKKTSIAQTLSERDQYLPRMQWSAIAPLIISDKNEMVALKSLPSFVNSNKSWSALNFNISENGGLEFLSIQRLNRWQNHWELLFCNPNSGKTSVMLEEKDSAYVEISDNLIFLPEKSTLLFTSESSGYRHIKSFNYKTQVITPITAGNWEVLDLIGYIPKTETLLFSSTELNVNEDHLYLVHISGKNKRLISSPGYSHSVVELGPNGHFYYEVRSKMDKTPDMGLFSNSPIGNYVSATVNPAAGLAYDQRIIGIGNNFEKPISSNSEWSKHMQQKGFQPVMFTQFWADTTAASFTKLPKKVALNAYVILPANFDIQKKYPVMMHIYGGPGANQVKNAYMGRNFIWHQYLASKGYMIVVVDNRGTGRRGADFKKSTYLQLGKLEALDHAAVAKQLGKLPFVDSSRIGIWGWSFGGYMSSLAITKSPTIFKAAIAVAPVTNWQYYDNIYTERYLRRPQDNPKGYFDNSPINFTQNIKGKYLLIHGSADDNVHWQNSAMMINSMIKSGVNYNFEIYPNRNHGIGDPDATKHLYRLMTQYILDNL